MSDPYKVLGISRDATDEEIKKAYRDMSRKYHPDANVNNPNKDKAEEMFKLVQQAYNQIMNERKYGGSSYNNSSYGNTGYDNNPYGNSGYGQGDFGGFGNFGGFGGFGNFGGRTYTNTSENNDPHYTAASNYINNGHYQEALNVLNNIENRTAYWYFLSAVANNGVGNNILALDLAKTAVSMEPDNLTYQRLLQALENGDSWYSSQRSAFGGDASDMYCCSNPCATLCLLNLCCHPC